MPDPLILKQVYAVIDDRTTLICLDAAGSIKRVDEPFETINGDFMAPPFHWGCRSNVMPYMPGMVNEQREEANAELQRRPKEQRDKRNFKKVGAPPVEQDDWLAEWSVDSEPNVPPLEPLPGEDELGPVEPVPDPDAVDGETAWDSVVDVYSNNRTATDATHWYVDGGYEQMNKVSRGQADTMSDERWSIADEANRDVDTMFDIARPTTQSMIVWRGLKDAGSYGSEVDMTGLKVHDDAFMSTSTWRQAASDFGVIDATNPVLIRIEIPQGSKVIRPAVVGYAADSYVTYEREVLLPRGTALRILSDTVETLANGREIRVWHAIVVPT